MGEAGIGKSRLLRHFHEQITVTPHTWIEAGAGAFFQNTPFYPVTEILRQFLGEAQPQDQVAQLETQLSLAGLKPAETIPLIAPLLNLPLPADYPPSSLPPEQQRRRLLATLVAWVLGPRTQPLVIVIEDLHWADPSTLELIRLLVDQGTTARLLLLYTARPEFRAPWAMRAHHTQITLNRLGVRDIRTIVAQMAASKALSDETVATVVERTGGVPLFVEELTRAVLESGDERAHREIPATLHDSLMARLDRLGSAKEVIQIGAVIGNEFSYELLHVVHPIAEQGLQEALRSATDAELVYVRGIAPDSTYQFKHALIRDAAYEALLKARRRDLHRMVAQTITDKFTELAKAHPEVLARHWTEAGETEQAIAAWLSAGKSAESRNAFKEALGSYQRALTLLEALPESAEYNDRELELSQSVVSMLYVTKGYTALETVEATEWAAELAQKSGNLTQLVDVMVSRGFTAYFSGDSTTAGALADRGLELSLREGSPINLGRLYTLLILTRYWRGDLAGVDRHFTIGLKFFDDPDFRQIGLGAAAAFAHASWNAWMLGRTDVARERIVRMIAHASENNPYQEAFSGYFSAVFSVYLRDYNCARALAARALELSEKHQYPYVAASSRCALGHALAQLGNRTRGYRADSPGNSRFARNRVARRTQSYHHVLGSSTGVQRRHRRRAGNSRTGAPGQPR